MRNGNFVLRRIVFPSLFVLILPMRNGNTVFPAPISFEASWFLSYLWGMETLVLQVYQMGVNLFLSYLWGMETFLSFSLIITSPSSYPTYEEWKRIYSHPANKTRTCSYPTYEEWKLEPMLNVTITPVSSYPTYEEWKLFSIAFCVFSSFVLILPMRNGN